MEHIKTNRTWYLLALINLGGLVLMVGSYNAGHRDARANLNTSATSADPTPSELAGQELAECRLVLELTGDFNPSYCAGIQEDDERLILTYETIRTNKPEYTKVDNMRAPSNIYYLCDMMYQLQLLDANSELTDKIIMSDLPEDLLYANNDVCEDLGYFAS